MVGCVLLLGCDALAPDELELGYGEGSFDGTGNVSRADLGVDGDTQGWWIAPTWYLSPRGTYPLRASVAPATGTSAEEALGGDWEVIAQQGPTQGPSAESQEDQGYQGDETQDPEGEHEGASDVVVAHEGGKEPWWAGWAERILMLILGALGLYSAPKVHQKVKTLRKKGS